MCQMIWPHNRLPVYSSTLEFDPVAPGQVECRALNLQPANRFFEIGRKLSNHCNGHQMLGSELDQAFRVVDVTNQLLDARGSVGFA